MLPRRSKGMGKQGRRNSFPNKHKENFLANEGMQDLTQFTKVSVLLSLLSGYFPKLYSSQYQSTYFLTISMLKFSVPQLLILHKGTNNYFYIIFQSGFFLYIWLPKICFMDYWNCLRQRAIDSCRIGSLQLIILRNLQRTSWLNNTCGQMQLIHWLTMTGRGYLPSTVYCNFCCCRKLCKRETFP